jgi:glycosyltransferase involved in cell wall biosynthesis
MRIYQLVRQISVRHDVTLLSNAWPADRADEDGLSDQVPLRVISRQEPTRLRKRIGQLRSLVSPLPFACRVLFSDELQDALDELSASTQFDLIYVESSPMCCLRFPPEIPIVLDEHNIEYELYHRLYSGERSALRRGFNWVEYRRFRRFEENCWRRAGGCAVTSAREEPIVRAVAPNTETMVVPNSVDLDYFKPWSGDVTPDTVVFNGILDYRPNLDAAFHLVDELWPLVLARRPSARLTIVGRVSARDARALSRPTVEVIGRVKDIRPHIQSAAVVAVPIRIGGGTRLKVVEAMSMGKAIVTTSIGCEGIDVRNGEHLLIADDDDSFAARVVQLFDDAQLRADLGVAGRALAEARYSWNLAGDGLDELFRRILAASGPRSEVAADPESVGVLPTLSARPR